MEKSPRCHQRLHLRGSGKVYGLFSPCRTECYLKVGLESAREYLGRHQARRLPEPPSRQAMTRATVTGRTSCLLLLHQRRILSRNKDWRAGKSPCGPTSFAPAEHCNTSRWGEDPEEPGASRAHDPAVLLMCFLGLGACRVRTESAEAPPPRGVVQTRGRRWRALPLWPAARICRFPPRAQITRGEIRHWDTRLPDVWHFVCAYRVREAVHSESSGSGSVRGDHGCSAAEGGGRKRLILMPASPPQSRTAPLDTASAVHQGIIYRQDLADHSHWRREVLRDIAYSAPGTQPVSSFPIPTSDHAAVSTGQLWSE